MFTVASARADTYSWTNFQSDIPGVAQHVDPNLVNPWGMSVSSWRHDLGQRQRHRCFDSLPSGWHSAFAGRDDSDGRAEQRSRQSHWTSLQQHATSSK